MISFGQSETSKTNDVLPCTCSACDHIFPALNAGCMCWLRVLIGCLLHFHLLRNLFSLFFDSDWKTVLAVFQNSGNASEFGMTTVI